MSDLKEQLKTWPAEIWLNTGDDETLAAFDEYAEVSWCSLPQGPADVRYVREDRAPAAAPIVQPVADVARWIRNNYQDYATVDNLCEALVAHLATPASSTADAKDAAITSSAGEVKPPPSQKAKG